MTSGAETLSRAISEGKRLETLADEQRWDELVTAHQVWSQHIREVFERAPEARWRPLMEDLKRCSDRVLALAQTHHEETVRAIGLLRKGQKAAEAYARSG